jgi:hypothetical protein
VSSTRLHRRGIGEVEWARRPSQCDCIRTQFHHVIDIAPTILEATGIQAPVMVNGIAQKPIEGVSMLYTFDKANANAPSKRDTQYFEMMGNRAIYHNGWIATTTPPQGPWLMGLGKMPDVINGYTWELYNVAEDFSQNNDLAAKMPDKLRDMKELFLVEAAKYNVLPLDNDVLQRVLSPRPSPVAGKTVFTYSGEVSGIPYGSAPNVLGKSYSISADVEIPQGGAEGMLNTLGGRFGGYGLYLVKASRFSPTCNSLRNASDGKARQRSRPVGTPSCLTSNTRAGVPAKAAPVFCQWTARKSTRRKCRTQFRS